MKGNEIFHEYDSLIFEISKNIQRNKNKMFKTHNLKLRKK